MHSILDFPTEIRKKAEYRIIPVPCKDYRNGRGMFPAICTVDIETGVVLKHTFFEFYLLPRICKNNALVTIMTAAKRWVQFLNYILHYETISGIEQVDRDILKRFADYIRHKDNSQCKQDNEEIAPDTWFRILNEVKKCLCTYYNYNCDKTEFRYSPDDLDNTDSYYNRRTGKVLTQKRIDWSEPVKPKPRKMRYLPEAYLAFWVYEVKMHAPHLLLAHLLQAYGGLREGEVVNITRDRIHVPAGSGLITINLLETAEHVAEYEGKTPKGHLKRFKEQAIYPAFKNEVAAAYKQHLKMEEIKFIKLGKRIDPCGPLFTLTNGNPLTTDSYNKETKRLFREHFVPDLEAYCLATGQYEGNKALLDAYKTEFFGNHAFRHWFTMYLKVHEELDDTQVAAWRGDTTFSSYLDYMHRNQEILENYERVAFHFQIEMLEAIKSGRAESFLSGDDNGENRRDS